MDMRAHPIFDVYVINDDFIRYPIQWLNPYNAKLIGLAGDRILLLYASAAATAVDTAAFFNQLG